MEQVYKPSVIRQKGESQSDCFKKTKHVKFSEEGTFLSPWYAHAYFPVFEFTPQIFAFSAKTGK